MKIQYIGELGSVTLHDPHTGKDYDAVREQSIEVPEATADRAIASGVWQEVEE